MSYMQLADYDNVDIVKFLNNQIELYDNPEIQKLTADDPDIADYLSFANAFKGKDLTEIMKVIGGGSSSNPNKTAARLLDIKINQVLEGENSDTLVGSKLPNQNTIFQVIQNGAETREFNSTKEFSDGTIRYGKYRVTKKEITDKGYTVEQFLENKNDEQGSLIKEKIDKLVLQEWQELNKRFGSTLDGDAANILMSNLLRNVFHGLRTGTNVGIYRRSGIISDKFAYAIRKNEIGVNEMDLNSKALLQYYLLKTGGLGEQYTTDHDIWGIK